MIDLHMHSYYSDDGEFSPTELIERCVRHNIKYLSVTDHNCVRANAEAEAAARTKGIRYLPGIEIDCVYQGNHFHMLGYGIDYRSDDFRSIEDHIRLQSREASGLMLAKTREMRFDITEEEMHDLSKDTFWPETWTGEMFAELLLARADYRNHPLLEPYRTGGTRSDNPFVNFYWDFYSQGKPCYVRIDYPQMEPVIDLIHRNHGLAVLAHPGINLKGQGRLPEGLVKLGLDGVEAYSSYHLPEQASRYYGEAKQYRLFTTCGSDFHGKTKPSIEIGKHGCPLSVREILSQSEKIFG